MVSLENGESDSLTLMVSQENGESHSLTLMVSLENGESLTQFNTYGKSREW